MIVISDINAKQKGIIKKVKPLIDELIDKVNFYIHPKLYQDILLQTAENDV